MDNGNKLPVRKRNRLKDYDYGSSGAYFITVCTKDRKNIFWDKERSDFVGEDIILPPENVQFLPPENVQLSPHGKIADVGEDIILPPENTQFLPPKNIQLSPHGKIADVGEDIILPSENVQFIPPENVQLSPYDKIADVGEDIILPHENVQLSPHGKIADVGEDIILPPENVQFLPPENVQLSPYGKIAEESITAIPEYYPHIKLLQYVVMPNHIHMILFIPYDSGRMISSPTSISTAVGQMKRCVSKKVGSEIWQRSFHDHVIRDKNDYERISKYIYDNPIKWQYDCFYVEE